MKIIAFIGFFIIFTVSALSQSGEDMPVGEFTGFSFSSPSEQLDNQWKVDGKKAVVDADGNVDIEEVKARIVSKSETYDIIAERGKINKEDQIVHVEGNVVIKTESGMIISTDYLDYFAKTKEFKSESRLEITKKDISLTGDGFYGSIENGLFDIKRNIKIVIYGNQLKEFSL